MCLLDPMHIYLTKENIASTLFKHGDKRTLIYLDRYLLQLHLTWTPDHINDTVMLWVLTSQNSVGNFGCFGGTFHLHLKPHGVITRKTTGDNFYICGEF